MMGKPLNVFECPLSGVINVEASAGTGKTWNICGLYLRFIIEQRRKPSEILVVTFTEAATAELRDRIRCRLNEVWRALKHLQTPQGDPFVADFIEKCVASPEEALNLLETALLSFDEAAIFTIHGFCHRALSESAFAAGQPFASDVATNGDEFLEQIAQDFWRRNIIPLEGDKVLELIGYSPSGAGGDRKMKPLTPAGLCNVLKAVISRPLAQLKWPVPPTPVDEPQLHAAIAAARRALQADIVCALDILKQGIAAGALSKTYYKSAQTVDDAAASWQAALQREDVDFRELVGAQLLTSSTIRQRTNKNKNITPDPLFDILDSCYRLLEQQSCDTEYLGIALLQQFIATSPDTLQKAKQRARVITFDDMLHNLHAALAGIAPVAHLADILRQRYPCALIDEFQDTDPLQLEIFKTIYGTEGPLLLVGDPKQAIYSFRGADLYTYLSARDAALECYTLAHNQRSTKDMIGAVNALFGANDSPFRMEGLGFVPAEAGSKPIPQFIDETGVARAALSVWQLQGGSKEAPLLNSVARKRVIAATVAEIVRLLAAGRQGKIRINERGLQPRDIALLVRTNHQGRELKVALAAAGVNAVELSQSDVFASFEAEEMERILLAVADPANTRLMRGALSTVLFGFDSKDIEQINNDEKSLDQWTVKFRDEYRDTWQKQGFARLWKDILTEEKVIERVLPLPGGERRATNLSHLAELLATQYRRQPGIESLLKWFAERRASAEGADVQQLRLESDQNLVQIVTKHRSKGLEYAIVFCPFAWQDGGTFPTPFFERYHDAELGKAVLDFTGVESASIAVKREGAEERLRVLYVALTRSIYRCYLAGGSCFAKAGRNVSAKASARSALNWLVAGQGQDPASWDKGETSFEHIEKCWETLEQQADGAMILLPLPDHNNPPCLESQSKTTQYQARTLTRKIPRIAWRLDSYSGLLRLQVGKYAAIDHDAIHPSPASGLMPDVPEHDILRFTRGALAGECVHSVFEKADFTRPDHWPSVIERALCRHFGAAAAAEAVRLQTMLADVLNTPLPGGWMLKQVSLQRRLAELDFFFPVDRVNASALFDLLEQHGWRGKRISFASLNGYLCGSIDFICEHDGRWYLIDWKSNYLGGQAEDYGAEHISETMRDASYDLQALIYLVALHRYLRTRLGGRYSARNNMGGAIYLFVRGVRPGWPEKGIWHWQPTPELIAELDALFSMQGRIA